MENKLIKKLKNNALEKYKKLIFFKVKSFKGDRKFWKKNTMRFITALSLGYIRTFENTNEKLNFLNCYFIISYFLNLIFNIIIFVFFLIIFNFY